jgi:excisionase family DNA binding protein
MAKLKSPTKSPTRDLLSVTQSSAKLKVSRSNIYDAIVRGRILTTNVGNLVLISRAALETYAASRKRTGRPPTKKKKR